MTDSYDLAIIGAGPGGYVCALRGAQLGMKTVCIDARAEPGGTCLNIGCIPSKALLTATHHLAQAQHQFPAFGIAGPPPKADLAAMMAHKDKGVAANVNGVMYLLRKNKVAYIHARARLAAKTGAAEGHEILLNDGGKKIAARHIVIATGGQPASLPFAAIDEKTILSSTGALQLTQIPERLLVIGAGYIGLELGQVWQRLGAKVSVVEALPRIAPGMDGEIARQFQRALEKQGLTIKTSTRLTALEKHNRGWRARLNDGKEEHADMVLVAVGRKPASAGLALDAAGVETAANGAIKVDENWQTSCAGIYAIGDVIAGAQLAHRASEEGIALAEKLAGQKGANVNYGAIPAVVYTQPEAASTGLTEEDVKARNIAYRKGRAPFSANGRAKVDLESEGLVKILAEKETGRILGVHILGSQAAAMIAEAVIAMEFAASAEDVARTSHAHPTLSEAVKEAALACLGRPLHQ